MTKNFLKGLVAALLIATAAPADAQTANIPGIYLSGSAPTGFSSQSFKMDCNNATPTSGQCWPLTELFDSSGNQATINGTDHGLTVHLGGGSIANTAFGATLNTTPSLANGNGVVPTQGGAVLSATNGSFTNILIGNVAESATNGIFANQLQGNAVLSVANPAFTALSDGTTKVTVNSGDAGLNTHIVGCAVGVCGLPTVTSNALVQGRISTPMTGTTPTSLIAAVTSQRIYVNSADCKNTSATATLVNLTDGSGGTILAQLGAGATYGGDNLNGGGAPLFWTTAGNALFAVDATTGASVTCNAAGYSSAN